MKDLLKEVRVKIDEDLVEDMVKRARFFSSQAAKLRKIVPDIEMYEKRFPEMNFDIFFKDIMEGGLNYPLQMLIMKSIKMDTKNKAASLAYEMINNGFIKIVEYKNEDIVLLNGDKKEVNIRLILCDRPFGEDRDVAGFIQPGQFQETWKNIYVFCGHSDRYVYPTIRHELTHMYQYNFEGYGAKIFGLPKQEEVPEPEPPVRPPKNETEEEKKERIHKQKEKYFENPIEFWPWVDTFYHGFLRLMDRNFLPNHFVIQDYVDESGKHVYDQDILLELDETERQIVTEDILEAFRQYVIDNYTGKDETHVYFINSVRKDPAKFKRFYKSLYRKLASYQWIEDILRMNDVNYMQTYTPGEYRKIKKSFLKESITFSTEPTPSVYFYGMRFKMTDSEANAPIRNYDSFSDRIQTHTSKGKRLKKPKNLGGRTTDPNDIAFIDYDKSDKYIKIHVIHVRPDYQGKGYATKLLKQFFEEEVPEGGTVNWGKLMNEASMRLFEKMKELYPNINQFGVKYY